MMKLPLFRSICGLAAVLGIALYAGGLFAQKSESAKTPGELLPAEAILYVRIDGSSGHEEAFQETAAYQALYESGLMEVFDGLLAEAGNQEQAAGIVGIFQHLQEHGVSLAVAVDAPPGKPVQVWATAVAPFAGEGKELLANVLTQVSNGRVNVQETKVKKRIVKYVKLDNPLVELGWWEQGEDLVLAFGMNAIANSIAVADEERPNITSHPLWAKYSHLEDDFDVTQLTWLDFESLRHKFGSRELPPLPGKEDKKRLTVNDILKRTGLETLNHLAMLHGYRGESLWTEILMDAPGDRTGLMSLLDQPTFVLDDLPAMPLHHVGLMAFSFDGKKSFQTVLKVVKDLAALEKDDAVAEIDDGLNRFKKELGLTPEEFLSALGPIHCIYTDSSQGLFGLGTTGIVQVEDQARLAESLKKIFRRIQQEVDQHRPGRMQVKTSEAGGRTVFTLKFPDVPFIEPTFSVGEDWMIVGLLPQAVDAQVMREDGRLFSWSIDEDLADALEMFPPKMASLQVVDPAQTYQFLMGLAPTILNVVEMGMKQNGALPPEGHLPIDAASIPPAELVAQPLFMNVAISTVDEQGWHGYARQSLPGIPFVGGSAMPGMGVGTASVVVALLLPAVQQARAAAQRAQSRNNLRQLALAMHNYYSAQDHFPEGTIPNPNLAQPEERLSWLVELLPYLDQAALYEQVDRKAGWQADENKDAFMLVLPVFQNPAQRNKGEGPYGKTNYVGIGGLGEEGSMLPVTDKKAGMFGYHRSTRAEDITDGMSNTIMIAESTDVVPWAEGGHATIRPFTKQPYLNGPDGIGSPNPPEVQMGFADGSVRSINSKIAPEIIEALTTIHGGEANDKF